MENQITIPQVREALKMTKQIAPIMNEAEYIQLITFYQNVIERYEKEEYPNGLHAEGD
ncbi:hypothetical protein [Enterococcus sp. LJL90]